MVGFSDMEAAHFGSCSLRVAGIRNLDRLAGQLWDEMQSNSAYRDRSTLLIVPEFGRDFDGSNTNGFLNHRSDSDSCRTTWMMCMGKGAQDPHFHEGLVRHIGLCPTIAALLGGPPENGIRTILTGLSL